MENREEEFEEQRRSGMGKGVEARSLPIPTIDPDTPVTQKQYAEIMTALGEISATRVDKSPPRALWRIQFEDLVESSGSGRMAEVRAEPRVEYPADHTEARHPFTKSVTDCLIPQGVKIPALEQYHGTSNLDDFVIGFESFMLLYGVPDQVMCKAFGSTLKGSAR
ncbi:Retrotransposon gag domain protein [Quillaja saponaria]|uniref:Retrotransposon gag domain protein n=1 Tax=Quillaja saponaria TaxID=32244 RepID=A0AAD7QCB0_QUISA|nr:Retrotransposon gag domain protein [Quillaja saponaria]